MQIAFLHTADVHVATFDALLPDDVVVNHLVRPDLLDRARMSGLDTVRTDTLSALASLAQADVVVCTCSTLGPLADAAANPVIRIDRPMMVAACAYGPQIAVALCLDSTRDATLRLLHSCADASITPQVILCTDAWPLFEAGDMAGYAKSIAKQIKTDMAAGTSCIILAQASMAVATDLLSDSGLPVLSSPALAVAQALEVASAKAP